jgi:predicted Zn-dependent protease
VWLAGEAAIFDAQSPHDFARADYYADRLVSRYPDQPEVHYFRGTLFTFENKNADAEREYRAELRISPQHVPAMLALANIGLENDQLEEAASLAKRSIELEPKNAEAHHVLGRVLMATNHFSESASELENAKRLAPDSATVRAHLAMVYGRLGRLQEAKAEAAAYVTLKNHEEVLAPPKTKRNSVTREQPK